MLRHHVTLLVITLLACLALPAGAQSDAELAALRAELQQLRIELDKTRQALAETRGQIDELTAANTDREALAKWRHEQLKRDAAERAVFRERLKLQQAREALSRTVAAESRKVEAMRQQSHDVSITDRVAPRQADVGYGYTQQYGWPYYHRGYRPYIPGHSIHRRGYFSPYIGYSPYIYRPYFYRPWSFRSGLRFGYHDDHVNLRLNIGDPPHHKPHHHKHKVTPLGKPRGSAPDHRPPIRTDKGGHPAYQLDLRSN